MFRVYQAVDSAEDTSSQEDTASLLAELNQLKQRLVDKDDVIDDLRARLDAESEERRKLTLILTEKQESPRPKSWLAKLLGS